MSKPPPPARTCKSCKAPISSAIPQELFDQLASLCEVHDAYEMVQRLVCEVDVFDTREEAMNKHNFSCLMRVLNGTLGERLNNAMAMAEMMDVLEEAAQG